MEDLRQSFTGDLSFSIHNNNRYRLIFDLSLFSGMAKGYGKGYGRPAARSAMPVLLF